MSFSLPFLCVVVKVPAKNPHHSILQQDLWQLESLATKQRGVYTQKRSDLGVSVAPKSSLLLLRKEVIQPHLPIRLPCYDFTPITYPTFGSSLSRELGH